MAHQLKSASCRKNRSLCSASRSIYLSLSATSPGPILDSAKEAIIEIGWAGGSIAEQVTTLAELKRRGLIRHIGLNNVTAAQVAEAQAITDIVCVHVMERSIESHLDLAF